MITSTRRLCSRPCRTAEARRPKQRILYQFASHVGFARVFYVFGTYVTGRIRSFSSPRPKVVETFQETLQKRPLTRPSPDFDRTVVGILSRAQELYPVVLHGFVLLPDGYVALATHDDPEVMAGFHGHLNTNLSKQVRRAFGWRDTVFPRRYGATELSEEPEVELERLRRLVALPVDEDWVASPMDWPGVSFLPALISGRPLRGHWVDRTAYWQARNRGETVSLADFTEVREVYFEPLPSLAHLSPESYRALVRSLVREAEVSARERHRETGTAPRGLAAIAALDVEDRPGRSRRRPRPWVFALDAELRRALKTALLVILAEYAVAAARLKKGDRSVRFPLHTFAPSLGFVREVEVLEPG